MDGIDAALERLVAAYTAACGTTDEFDPADETALDDLRGRVAPLRLPTDIEHVWRSFQELGVPGIIDTNSLGTVELAQRAIPYTKPVACASRHRFGTRHLLPRARRRRWSQWRRGVDP